MRVHPEPHGGVGHQLGKTDRALVAFGFHVPARFLLHEAQEQVGRDAMPPRGLPCRFEVFTLVFAAVTRNRAVAGSRVVVRGEPGRMAVLVGRAPVEHLERIIELDPDHAEARRALGYSQFDGQWMTQEEAMADRGYLRYQGRWRTRQEIEILERNREMEAAQKEWYVKINRWRDWLATDRAQQARQNLLAIQDPLAVRALAERLTDAPQPAVRILFAEVLAKQNTSEARQALAAAAMDDPVEEVRLSCLDYLEKVEDPAVIAYFVKELKSKDNRLVNRAGIALSYVGNASAVGPLIDALVTTHKFKIVTPGSGGNMSTTFSSAGSGMSMNSKPKLIQQQLRNQAVLEALAKLTGQNFSYDQRAWQYWHSSQRRRVNLDARRD